MPKTSPELAAAVLLLLTGAHLGYVAVRWVRRRRPAPCLPVLPPPRPATPPVPPLWYRMAWQAAMVATTGGRPAEATRLSGELVHAATQAFGAEHVYTRWAWQRLTSARLVDTLVDPSQPGAPREP